MKHHIRTTTGLAAGALALLAVPALAQQGATEDSGGIAEVIVTANKRAENVQDVAIPVTALNEEMIEQRFSRDLLDLGSIAPNLIVDPILGNGTAAISIRGIQLNDVEKSFDPPVGVFLDGVYLASTTGALLTVYDAQTIEVLRGPQGTLFGRNTIGGLMHIQRNRPTGEWGGKLSATYARYEQIDLKGVVNLPGMFDNTFKSKLAFVRLGGGGYFRNVTRGRREGDNDLIMISPQLQWDPNENLSLNLSYDYIRDRTPTRPVTSLTSAAELFGGAGPPFFGAGLGAPPTDAEFHRHPTTSLNQKAFIITHSYTVNGTYKLSDTQELALVMNYRDTKEDAIQEFDGVAAGLFNTQRPQQIDQFSTELRYQADYGPVKVVSGLYYFESDYNINQRTYFGGPETGGTDYQQSSKSTAVFAQLDWDFAEQWSLNVGGRYLKDEKEACGGLGQGPVSARTYLVSYGSCSAVRQAAPGFSNDIPGNPVDATGKKSWTKFTPKVGVSYKVADDVLLFVSYAEGFRSGGFNGRGNNVLTLGPYNPEKVKNIEFGMKSQWLDDRLQLNLAIFDTKYQDKQEDVVFPDPLGATVTIVQNAASAKLRGVEVELKALPMPNLSLGLNLGFLDSEYGKYEDLAPILDGPNAGQLAVIDKSKFKLRRAPKFTGDVNANYTMEMANDSALVFNVDYAYKDDYYVVGNTVNLQPENPGLVQAFGTLNASITYRTGKYRTSFFARNITSESHFQHVLDVGTTFGRSSTSTTPVPTFGLWTFGTISPPPTYGVEFEVKF